MERYIEVVWSRIRGPLRVTFVFPGFNESSCQYHILSKESNKYYRMQLYVLSGRFEPGFTAILVNRGSVKASRGMTYYGLVSVDPLWGPQWSLHSFPRDHTNHLVELCNHLPITRLAELIISYLTIS